MGAPGDLVWARWAAGSSSDVAFALCRIGNEGLLADAVELVPIDSRLPRKAVAYHDVFPAGDHTKDVDDNCELMFLNEATLLNNVLNRYHKDKIYTYVANILIAVNPYKDIKDLYATPTIRSYQGKSLGEKAPHVFALADKAFRDMRNLKQSQSIIVSGESGAGKTESTKYILKYLCDLWAAGAGPVEQKILDANPILEAFGNAKTTRNNNSSRFGKFMEVHFSNKWQVVGGHISHYLLEKSRICTQSPEERNYHVFYLLCAGAPPELRQKLRLTKPDDFNYLRSGCTQYFTSVTTDKRLTPSQCSKSHIGRGPLRDPLLDDVEDFQRLHQALSRTGLSDAESYAIYCTVGAVLHLGNIDFEDDPDDVKGGCRVKSNSESCLSFAAQLLGVDHSELRMSLISRLMQSSRGGLKGTAIMVPLKTREAANARDALAKALYSRLFDHIVSVINTSIPLQASSYYIGVLDIAGFEYFTVNSYEQFCINYCNEKLQQFFNERILKNEQELYRREGLLIPEIAYVDNQDCIELIESKNGGIFNLLDEESKLPRPDCGNFTLAVHKRWGKESQGSRVTVPRASRLKAHRSLRDDDGFLLRHFAGAVCYNTSQFIEKNNDALHASLEFLVQESGNGLVRGLFSSAKDNNNTKGKLTFISVGSKFQTQLAQLMDKLKQNGTNFVRCIKPNSKMIHSAIEPSLVLTQLECSGTIAVLELMEHGYPSRAPFNDLYNMYKSYLPPKLSKLSPKTFCEGVLGALGLHSRDYRFGVSRVFFRPGKYSEFDTLMRSDPENLRTLVTRLERWLVRSRWRKAIFGVVSIIKLKNKILFRRKSLIVIQKTVRSYLVRKQHRPRYRGIVKIRALENNIRQMETTTQQLKKDKDKAQKKIKELRDDITTACKQIKDDPKIKSVAIDNLYNRLVSKMENEMAILQKSMQDQKNREEQERLRKIQEEMRVMEEAKRREAQRIREEEERRKQKAEMEARRKVEEAERLRREEQDRLAAIKLQQQLEQDQLNEQENMQRLEQERRDHEMALRLATESGGLVEGSPPQLRSFASLDGSISGDNRLIRSEKVRAQQAVQEKQKYDLSKWKYSELRDTINTSCDIELLEACRHEFHRRLKVYHAWKAKNQRKTTNMSDTERAPRSVMDAAAKAPRVQQKSEILGARHRYFRIPFMRPGAGVTGGDKKGWWYAHFDGQYVARQMELHPDKSPVLLLAGVDDMQMCELSLEETGLTRKRGAEILEHEFSREWLRNGGPPFIPAEQRKA